MMNDYLRMCEDVDEILRSRRFRGRKLKGFRLWYFLGFRDALRAMVNSEEVA